MKNLIKRLIKRLTEYIVAQIIISMNENTIVLSSQINSLTDQLAILAKHVEGQNKNIKELNKQLTYLAVAAVADKIEVKT